MNVIEVKGLTKDYGRGRGIFGVSFSVGRGETLGFLGPNGAGKTTTLRHLMGFLHPDSGEARILGMDCFRRRKSRSIWATCRGRSPFPTACGEKSSSGSRPE